MRLVIWFFPGSTPSSLSPQRNALTSTGSSTKRVRGHPLGAAGAAETVVCDRARRDHGLPPTATLQTPDPLCGFPVVRTPAPAKVDYALTNSFGFGGANATLILRKWS